MYYSHIDRQSKGFEGSSKLDYSGALMIATIKFASFGFNIADGRRVAVTNYNKRMKIAPYPSLIEYFGWLCYFGGFLVGPTCEYMDYYRFTNYYFVSSDKNISPYKPALQKFVYFIITARIVAFVGQRYNYFRMLEDDFATLSFYKKYVYNPTLKLNNYSHSLSCMYVSRMFAFEVAGLVQHCKYGCLWLLAEGASVLSGFGYNGVKAGKHRWDRVSNVNWCGLETAQSCRDLSNAWNLGSNVWLRHYVYMRLCPPGTDPTSFALVATYTLSASWHSFHPGYYALLSSFGMFQVLGRRVRYIVRPFTVSPIDQKTPLPVWKKLYDTVYYIATTYTTAILMAPFELLYVSRTLKVWASVYYIHVWDYMITWSFVTFLGPILLQIQKYRKEQAILKHKELVTDGHEHDVKGLKIKRNLI